MESAARRPIVKRWGRLRERAQRKRLSQRFRQLSPRCRQAFEQALRSWHTAEHPECTPGEVDAFVASDHGKRELRAHLEKRTRTDRKNVIPWIDRFVDLDRATVLEIGCGTGASTVAVARTRCALYELEVELKTMNAVEIEAAFFDRHFDLIVFYASLEHMTLDERLRSLRSAWAMLPSHGLLCVVEAPNRLACIDDHTSLLPFFHWLPDELAMRYAPYSDREDFGEHFRTLDDGSMLRFLRLGRGVSFHDFHLALDGNLSVLTCLWMHGRTGRKRGPKWRRTHEGRHATLIRQACPEVHPAWFFPSLDLMIEKPASA